MFSRSTSSTRIDDGVADALRLQGRKGVGDRGRTLLHLGIGAQGPPCAASGGPARAPDWHRASASADGCACWSPRAVRCRRRDGPDRWSGLFSGKAGQAMVKSAPSSSSSASATGPILPASVESKVEQYLKKICLAPLALSQRQAASDCATASAAGMVRDFSATTMASACGASPRGSADGLHRVHAAPRQRVGEIRGAGEVVGDAAQQHRSGPADARRRRRDRVRSLPSDFTVLPGLPTVGRPSWPPLRSSRHRQRVDLGRALEALQPSPSASRRVRLASHSVGAVTASGCATASTAELLLDATSRRLAPLMAARPAST